MQTIQLTIGAVYTARVSNKNTRVKLLSIEGECYHCLNLSTGRRCKLFSAEAFSAETVIVAPIAAQPVFVAPQRLQSQVPHLIITARAGTGKTTTLIGGLNNLKGIKAAVTPSVQQRAIWDAIAESKGAQRIAICAFNKSIAEELERRVPSGVESSTISSLGYRLCRESLGRNIRVNKYRISDIVCELLKMTSSEVRDKKFQVLIQSEKLVNLVKQNLVEPTVDEMEELASYYELELETEHNSIKSEVFDLVPKIIQRCKAVTGDKCIDFADMIWLPVVLNLPIKPYDLLLVDEAQDLNRCQHELVKRAGKRLVFCGDPKQAIYGFAGADAKSMQRLQEELSATSAGCQLLPLTETRRCGKRIVREANTIVEDFTAHESNPEGEIRSATFIKDAPSDYRKLVLDGDMLLCRVNAPLVAECFSFIKMGRKANIQGRDVGQSLISTIKKQKAESVVELVGKLSHWLEQETLKEQQKKRPCETKIINLQDRFDCLCCFCEGVDSISQLISKIEAVFTDDKTSPGIKLSSIHKSKGLESANVFLLEPGSATVPHKMARSEHAIEQEWNLRYVGITRAIHTLTYVK